MNDIKDQQIAELQAINQRLQDHIALAWAHLLGFMRTDADIPPAVATAESILMSTGVSLDSEDCQRISGGTKIDARLINELAKPPHILSMAQAAQADFDALVNGFPVFGDAFGDTDETP